MCFLDILYHHGNCWKSDNNVVVFFLNIGAFLISSELPEVQS